MGDILERLSKAPKSVVVKPDAIIAKPF